MSLLKITLKGVDRQPLCDSTRVIVYRHRDRKQVADVTIDYPHYVARIQDLEPDLYAVRAFPAKHRASGKFARTGDEITLHLPVDADAVRNISRTSRTVEQELGNVVRQWGDVSFNPEELAGLYNVWSKLRSTSLGGDQPLASLVKGISRVNPDRIWFEPHPLMLELARKAVDGEEFMRKDSGSLHRQAGYRLVQSFKTLDRYGNLQLTFMENRADGHLLVDADVDEAAGIEHLFQVLRNALPGVRTNPFDIHQILTFHQELDVGYELVT